MAAASQLDILDIKRRRLHKLERQRALHGADVDPAIIIEIEDTAREIKEIETGSAPETAAGQYLGLASRLDRMEARQDRHTTIQTATATMALITLLLVLTILARPAGGIATSPVFATPAPTAGIARPAITTPIAGAGAPLGGR
jgi:hypothetical protein